MKSAYKYLLFLLACLTAGMWLMSCSKDELAAPSINYIRITNPASSDSLVASANQGQMIAIIGSNLQSVRQVWFNDQKASVIPTFVTSSTVITRIPSQIPIDITNKLKMIFAGGDSLLYDFKVDISKPLIDHVRSEYVNEGDSLFIYGDYFYSPLTVTLGGGVTAEILSLSADAKTLVVKMPSGVQPGPLTIATNFGNKASIFWMQDNRNIILDFDHMSGTNGQGISQGALWHPVSGDFDYATSSHSGVPSINGNYLFAPYGSGGYSAWSWSEIWAGNAGAPELDATKNIPQEAFSKPQGI